MRERTQLWPFIPSDIGQGRAGNLHSTSDFTGTSSHLCMYVNSKSIVILYCLLSCVVHRVAVGIVVYSAN